MPKSDVEHGSQLQVEPQGGIKLRFPGERQLTDPVTDVRDVDGSDLIGLDLRVDCEAATRTRRPGPRTHAREWCYW